jgi:hypothetical protein
VHDRDCCICLTAVEDDGATALVVHIVHKVALLEGAVNQHVEVVDGLREPLGAQDAKSGFCRDLWASPQNLCRRQRRHLYGACCRDKQSNHRRKGLHFCLSQPMKKMKEKRKKNFDFSGFFVSRDLSLKIMGRKNFIFNLIYHFTETLLFFRCTLLFFFSSKNLPSHDGGSPDTPRRSRSHMLRHALNGLGYGLLRRGQRAALEELGHLPEVLSGAEMRCHG